jgi:hypothetical protein
MARRDLAPRRQKEFDMLGYVTIATNDLERAARF